MGLLGLLMAYYGGLWGILSGLTKSTDHASSRSRVPFTTNTMIKIGYL